MDPCNIPFNALIVGPTNSGKMRFLVNQVFGPFRGKFDYIVLICPTFAHSRTLSRFAERDPRFYTIICEQHQVETWLKVASFTFEGDNTLIVLDDCAASKRRQRPDGRAGQTRLFSAAFRHQRVGADAAAFEHRQTFLRERGGDRAVLHALGQNHEGGLRRIRRRSFTRQAPANDCASQRAEIRPFDYFASPPVWDPIEGRQHLGINGTQKVRRSRAHLRMERDGAGVLVLYRH